MHISRRAHRAFGVDGQRAVAGGRGAAEREQDKKEKNVGWGDVVGSIVASATSTETVHHALLDLFPSEKYFRLIRSRTRRKSMRRGRGSSHCSSRLQRTTSRPSEERFETVARILRPKTPRSLWRRFRDALREEIQVLQTTMDDDLYLPNNPDFLK